MTEKTWRHEDKPFRRKKKHVGEDWSVDVTMLEMAKRASGLICRTCHEVKRWKDLDSVYRPGKIVRNHAGKRRRSVWRDWTCLDCGDVVKSEQIVLGPPARHTP